MGGGPQYKEAGGGPATGLANDFISFLQQGLNTGSFGGASSMQRFGGADPMGATGGIAGILNDLLSSGGGKIGGALSQQIKSSTEDNVGALRARFGASGGTAFGTPAAYAEGVLRSQQAPQLVSAIGGLQMQALSPILQLLGGLSQKGIAQREGYLQPSKFASTVGTLAPIVGMGLGLATGNPLAAAGGAASMAGQYSRGPAPSIDAGTGFAGSAPSLFSGVNFGMNPNFRPTPSLLDWTYR